MRKLEDKLLNKYIKSMDDTKKSFVVDKKRQVKSVFFGDKCVLINKPKNRIKINKHKKEQVVNLISQVSKSVNKFIVENNFEVEEIKQNNSPVYTNRKLYRSIQDNGKFYYIDIKHCFWRISFLKGYINDNLYLKYKDSKEFKMYRNMSLACIVAPRVREYHDKGCKFMVISEEKSLWQRIYDNIRFTSYNLMGYLKSKFERSTIGFITDGIMINNMLSAKKVSRELNKLGFECTIHECIKKDEVSYLFDGVKTKKMH